MKAKKQIFILFFVLLIISGYPSFLFAQEINEEEKPTVVEVDEEDQEKIDSIRKEIQEKVEEKLGSIMIEIKKRAWIGVIKNKSDLDFDLETKGEKRSVTINDEIKIINLKRKEIEFKDLDEGQRVIAMGYLQTDGTLEAKRIVLVANPEEKRAKVIFGEINNRSEEEEILSVSNSQGKEYELIFTEKTVLRVRSGNKISKIKYEEIENGQKIIAVIEATESNGSTYNVIRILVLTENTLSPTPTTTEEE